MPTIQVDFEDLQKLMGITLPASDEELDEVLAYVKGEVKMRVGSELHIEIKDSNRPDLWNVEGIVRALKGFLSIEVGAKKYRIAGNSGVKIHVAPKLRDIRPYIACAVVKGLELDDRAIRSFIHLQDKLDLTYGRRRRRTSIGLYNFDLITPPLHYAVSGPDEISFTPLGFDEEMTLKEILEKHPKGIEYGHIVRSHPVWPILLDSKRKVLSFPPIINSNDLGRVTEETRNVLIEVTGTRLSTVINTLNITTIAVSDRGGEIYSAEIYYPYGDRRIDVTPQFTDRVLEVDIKSIRELLGLDLTSAEVKELLLKARFGVKDLSESKVAVEVPFYRVDVIHPVDVIEDIAVAYGYNRIKPAWRPPSTIGGVAPEREFANFMRELMLGLGYQEVLTFTLTNLDSLFVKMNLECGKAVEIANPKIMSFTHVRSWLLPSLMEFLGHNTHVEYPQRIFEIGKAVIYEEERENRFREIDKLASVSAHVNADFTEVKSCVNYLMENLGVKFDLEPVEHGSFIDGRSALILVDDREVGVLGEVHPEVLVNWGLEIPVAALELDLTAIYEVKKRSL